MSYVVDFENVSTIGLESSPVAEALAGLRANEARYFKNKYDHSFTVEPASKAKQSIAYVNRILREERDIVIGSPPLEATSFEVEVFNSEVQGLTDSEAAGVDEMDNQAGGIAVNVGHIGQELEHVFAVWTMT